MNIILRQFGRLVCAVTRKHKRGRQLGMDILSADGVTHRTYQCNRCGATWKRKLKLAKLA